VLLSLVKLISTMYLRGASLDVKSKYRADHTRV